MNNVVSRFLPITQSVLDGLEAEPKITDFTLIKELGEGSYSHVLLAQHNITQAQYAIKAIILFSISLYSTGFNILKDKSCSSFLIFCSPILSANDAYISIVSIAISRCFSGF